MRAAPSLSRSVGLNLAAQVAPALVALVVMPRVIAALGLSEFGILALGWAVVGNVGLFDLGLGRALTHSLAVDISESEGRAVSRIVWTSLLAMLVVGLVFGMAAWAVAPHAAAWVARNEPTLIPEATRAFLWLAYAIPIVVVTAGCRGILEACSRFDVLTAIGVPSSFLNYAAPLVVVWHWPHVSRVIAVLLAVRVATLFALLAGALNVLPAMRRVQLQCQVLKPLFRYGSWATVSSVASPFILQADRFIIGMAGSLAAVGYYSSPSEVLARLAIIPTAVVQVLFPAMTAELSARRPDRGTVLMDAGSRFLLTVLVPVLAVLSAIAPEALTMWLGREFSENATPIARVLVVATLVNASAWIPFAVVQAAGRPDLTARLHVAEVPLHLAVAVTLVRSFGPVGAAWATLIRASGDAVAVFLIAGWVVRAARQALARLALLVAGTCLLLVLCAVAHQLLIRVIAATLVSVVCLAVSVHLLTAEERAWLRSVGRRLRLRDQ